MQIKKGIPVSPGIAISRAMVLDAADQPIPRRTINRNHIEPEIERLNQALKNTIQAITEQQEKIAIAVGKELAKIFAFHAAMLQDPHLVSQITNLISSDCVTAEYAVYKVLQQLAQQLSQGDKFAREKANDVWDLEKQLINQLVGQTSENISALKHQAILVAHELTPSQTASLDKKKIKAIATDAGGRTSHTAILAHALGIPAIVGLEDIASSVKPGQNLIIDGNRGIVIIDPNAAQLLEYRQYLRKIEAFENRLDEMAELPPITKDGTDIKIFANIEFPDEIRPAVAKGAQGIGLYRSEFLFLTGNQHPTEDEQFAAYKKSIDALEGKSLTIRTLDLGADKLSATSHSNDRPEANPFLGCRSIRWCLQHLPEFRTQLRAILRASAHGPVKIMFPLISSVMEVRQAKLILNDVREDLEDEGIAYASDIPVGIMIEVPSAAIQAKTLAKEVDFFSIGTNDLIQYTVAVDRGNERIASLYSPAHPAVLTLIKDVIRAAARADIEVSLCGEMASEPEFTMLLLGLGLRKLSITPPAIPEIKKIIRSLTIEKCKRVARKACGFDSDRQVSNYLRDEISKIIPEVFDGRSIGF